MKRILSLLVLAAAVVLVSLVGTGASDSTGSSYLVDAEFANAFSVIPGEDVKIAGVKVGQIKDLDVTARQTASVLIEITEPGFGDWRSDAECTIRPQSLIGEKFVECTPTQPRAAGAQAAPPLKTKDLDGDTVAVLPIDRTRKPIDLDLVNNTLRLPYRERLTILLNEFGAGVAGRGADLGKIIKTADPALQATDEVLKLIGDQNATLRRLAVDSDTAIAPLARDREKLADFITQARQVSDATASKRVELEANIKRLPTFLRELRPTMDRLGSLADQGTPLLGDLNEVAPDLSRFVRELGPFSQAATPALTSLGDASVTGRTALNKSRPTVRDLKNFAGSSKGLAKDLNELTASLRDTGGIERLMDYAFYQVAAVNGFDQFGHYLRAQLLVNLCSTYAVENDPACTANFVNEPAAESRSASLRSVSTDSRRDPYLARTDAVLRGADADAIVAADKAAEKAAKDGEKPAAKTDDAEPAMKLPAQFLPDAAATQPEAPAPSAAAPAEGTPTPAPDAGTSSLLDYLLGDTP